MLPGDDWLNVAAASLTLLLAAAAFVPGVLCLSTGRAVRVVDVVVQARWRVPEPLQRRGWRAVGIGVVLIAAAVVTLLVPSQGAGLVFSGAMLCTVLLRARRLDQTQNRQPGLPAQRTSSDPVPLQKPHYPDRADPDQ